MASFTIFPQPLGFSVNFTATNSVPSRYTADGTAFYVNDDQVSKILIAPTRSDIVSAISPHQVRQVQDIALLSTQKGKLTFQAPNTDDNCPSLTSVLHCQKAGFIALYFEVIDPMATGEEKMVDEFVFYEVSDSIRVGVLPETNELYCILIEQPFTVDLFPPSML